MSAQPALRGLLINTYLETRRALLISSDVTKKTHSVRPLIVVGSHAPILLLQLVA
jgi:hypothetical protein